MAKGIICCVALQKLKMQQKSKNKAKKILNIIRYY